MLQMGNVSVSNTGKHTNNIIITAVLLRLQYFMNKFTKPGYINIIDSSNVAHYMWDYILENWNGRNYADFVRNLLQKISKYHVNLQRLKKRSYKHIVIL